MALPRLGRFNKWLYPLFAAKKLASVTFLSSCHLRKHTQQLCSVFSSRLSARSFSILDVQSTFSDYEKERRTFNLTVPQQYNFTRDVIDVWASAEQCGKRDTSVPALWWIDDKGAELKFSFQQLSELSCKVANLLTGPCQLTHGDRLILILPRIPEWWMLNLACIRAGIVMSPGTTLLRAKDIQHRLTASGANCIISDGSTVEFVDEVYEDCPDLRCRIFVGDPADTRPGWLNFNDMLIKASDTFQTIETAAAGTMSLFFTSGTTGGPKMTEHSHSSYGLGHLMTARYFLQVGPTDVMWNLSDTGWAKSAWSSLFAPWMHGACVFVQHTPKFDPLDMLKVLSKYPISHLCTPPTATRLLVKERLSEFKFPHLRRTLCAGEPVNPELMDAWKAGTGLEIYEGYGQTETTLLCARYPCIEYRPGSMGKASPGIDLQVVNEDGVPVEPGTEGMLGVRYRPHRPIGLFARYLGDPERTESVFRGDFYLTGDRAHMDKDGYIFFVGRDDDVISSSGYRIGPFEVESALIEHPAVLESAVVSSPDPERGEVVKAFIILTPAYENSDAEKLIMELQEHVKKVTAPYKYPRKIEFTKELPKTISGKIRRVELREREWNKK
ncbi:acyl-coenzyme A synthetase ACSM3, mitochondrial-like [Littorina saxatilis]|uniref:acyl-coenzyme A synthetase ACSM3, mitochondrial-like n=1 Tax=Littorina saxatilis TaxID=31220 RepID=UPI0038B4A91D